MDSQRQYLKGIWTGTCMKRSKVTGPLETQGTMKAKEPVSVLYINIKPSSVGTKRLLFMDGNSPHSTINDTVAIINELN